VPERSELVYGVRVTTKDSYYVDYTAAVLASKAEAIVDLGQTWPQATKRRS